MLQLEATGIQEEEEEEGVLGANSELHGKGVSFQLNAAQSSGAERRRTQRRAVERKFQMSEGSALTSGVALM
jgi:hypothetical protein